jgi:hypothetical protein
MYRRLPSTAAVDGRLGQCRSAWIICDGRKRIPRHVPGRGRDTVGLSDRGASDGAGGLIFPVHRALRECERRRQGDSKCQCDCGQFHGRIPYRLDYPGYGNRRLAVQLKSSLDRGHRHRFAGGGRIRASTGIGDVCFHGKLFGGARLAR